MTDERMSEIKNYASEYIDRVGEAMINELITEVRHLRVRELANSQAETTVPEWVGDAVNNTLPSIRTSSC